MNVVKDNIKLCGTQGYPPLLYCLPSNFILFFVFKLFGFRILFYNITHFIFSKNETITVKSHFVQGKKKPLPLIITQVVYLILQVTKAEFSSSVSCRIWWSLFFFIFICWSLKACTYFRIIMLESIHTLTYLNQKHISLHS